MNLAFLNRALALTWASILVPFLLFSQEDTAKNELLFPFMDTYDPLQEDDRKLYGGKPSGVETEIEYNPDNGNYEYSQKFGNINYRPPSYLSFDEYQEYQAKKSMNDYWKEIQKNASEEDAAESGDVGGSFRPSINVEGEGFDRIFGGNTIEIRPNGSAELIFGVNSSKTENPAIPVNQRRITVFDFRQNIQLNVIGNIGDKLKIQTNFNTQATFDFENQMKLEYTGYEDEIIQKLELGNVSLPLQSSLISGSQSLFGVKSELKFGRLTVTSVYSQQKSERQQVRTEGGAQEIEFEVKADEYEGNKHYFLSHFFRDIYERALSNVPIINSSVNITRVEVWVTNTNFSTEQNRNIIAFQDLGESRRVYNPQFSGVTPNPDGRSKPASNSENQVYSQIYQDEQVRQFTQASQRLEGPQFNLNSRFDYNKVELARKLEQGRDFNLNMQLGYISLVQELQPNQVMAVAFEYTYNGRTYKVGEFSNESNGDEALILKMLKSNELNTRFPMWDLMMKNVYSIGAYQLNTTGFELGVWYLDRNKGIDINYLPIDQPGFNDRPLLQVLALDRINSNNAQVPDGVFDFLANPQITVNPENGRIFFPVLEPFGEYLRRQILDVTGDPELAKRYGFDSLYTNTQANAQYNFPTVNRFSLQGRYQSANSSEIALNAFNVPEGSVRVTAGGRQLTENTDYTVDYTLGRVKIINQGILEAGIPIDVSLESNSAFGINRKALFASRFDYKLSEELNFGGTFMNLSERPLTQKVNFGDEPISNTVMGIDGNWSDESQFLTSLVDKIPLINTKEKSTFTVMGEAAKLFPGHSRAIGNEGNSYIDDFEGSQSTIDMRTFTLWSIASTPQGQPDLFPEGANNAYKNDLTFNKNRAKLAWYTIDDLFFRDDNTTPDHIKGNTDIQQNHLMRQVFESEVFPNREFNTAQGLQNFRTNMFDLAFYPDEPGPYNYDVDPVGNATAGLTEEGTLARPETRWAGIQRRIDQTDFDAANVEFIQFWMLDPYSEEGTEGYPGSPGYETDGYLYFNIGNISEDVLKDEIKSFENGYPTNENRASDLSNPEEFTHWGRIPDGQQIVNAFDNNPQTRPYQDVGLDGLRSQEEQVFFDSAYVQPLQNRLSGNPQVLDEILEDPSHDDYNFYRDDRYDQQELNILERYKNFNGPEGNSPTSEQSSQINGQGYPTSASTLPDAEDINRDNTLDNVESYYQYRVDISKEALQQEGRNYINAIQETTPQGQPDRTVRWIQFRIPIREFDKKVGNIQDFRSIRFMRMFMKGFENPVVMRFARLELVRGEWRRYLGDLDQEGEVIANDPNVSFNVGAVNIEENASKQPVNYVLPPQLQREIQAGSPNLARQNEQSLQLQACGLEDGKAQAAFRNVQLDMRSFKKMQMFLHAEAMNEGQPVGDDDIRVFIRVGSDFTDNYYEYETPVSITRSGEYQNENISDQQAVWPLENNVVIEFEDLFRAKRERNEQMGLEGNVQLNQRYEVDIGTGRKVYVVGNPNLADARVVMIGIRNPDARDNPNDDGMPKCVEVWANELRLTHFDQSGGEAAMARVSANLADFATIQVAGQVTTPGWGALESKVSERQRETITNFDASAQLQLDKFLPEETGVKVPMYVGYSQNTSNPQFAPEEPDTPMEIYLDNREADERDSLKRISQKVTTRKSLNFTNVRKEKTGDGEARFYDISNLSATYAFTETNIRDFNTEYNFIRNYRGALAYSYSTSPKSYEPLSKIGFLKKSKYLRLIRDFNFTLVPKQVAINNNFDRRYSERKIRNLNPEATLEQPPFVDKAFNWNRTYNLSYDLSKSIKIDFSANTRALIREFEGEQVLKGDGDDAGKGGYELNPDGTIRYETESYELHRDSILTSLKEFGLTTDYNHNASVSYSVPLNKIPFLDWTNVSARYTGNYEWRRGPLIDPQVRKENIERGVGYRGDTLGHTVSNGQQLQLNTTLNLLSLYNKVPYLRDVNRGKPKRNVRNVQDQKKKKGEGIGAVEEEEEEEDDEKDLKVLNGFLKVLMSVKNVSGTYSLNRGITLPGFKHEATYLGMDPGAVMAPGMGFAFGQQRNFGDSATHFADWAGNEKEWLVQNSNLFNPYLRTETENISLRSSIQPVRDLRIDVTLNQTSSETQSSYWNYNDTIPMPRFTDNSTELITGSYSASILTIATAFEAVDSANLSVYNAFLDSRRTISNRLGASEGINELDTAGYTVGYDATHQDVLIPAFISAYTGQGADKVRLGGLRLLPLPNWRINYTGLNKIKFFQKYFRSVSVNHSYRSNYTVGGYQRQASRDNSFPLDSNRIPPQVIIGQVTISESFSPLINFDMTWKNSLLTRLEIRRDRTMTLSTSNNQLTEIGNMEYIIGSGYTLKDVKLPFTLRGNALKSDLTLRADFSIRDTRTLIRKIVENETQTTAGQRVYSLKLTGDYMLTKALTLRLFYDWVANRPAISNSFPTSNINAGFSLRFTLSG